MTKFTAGILVIGDEILSGRTKDTNSYYIANKLIDAGISLNEIKIIHDDKNTIIQSVLDFHKNYTYVFTTGGIGPTHDDITSESISIAFNSLYSFNQKAFNILKAYYPIGEFNEGRQKMAKMPKDAELILNPLTVAPGFKIKNVYVLPGVPSIMEKMFDNLLKDLEKGSPKKTISIRTSLFESSIAVGLEQIQNQHPDCSIGSYPYFNYATKSGGVNIVISSWVIEDLYPICNEIKDLISSLGGKSSII